MSDIQEEQKRLYKRAEENDYISKLEEIKDNLSLNKDKKETYLYEENSFQNMIVENKYYENKINELQDRIDKIVEFIEEEKTRLCSEISSTYKDELDRECDVNEDIFNELNKILNKLNELKGDNK